MLRVDRRTYRVGVPRRADVLRYLGYRGQELTPELKERLAGVEERCMAESHPAASLRSFAVRGSRDDHVELEGCTLRLVGRDIAAHLAGAHEVVLMAVTLGAEVDRTLRLLSLTDALEQVMFDAVATALVERATDAAEADARAYAASQGAFCSWRFSPGYGDLSLEVQPVFLAALDATRRLGITLTESNLMVPTKSVTALVGVHPTPQPGLASSCGVCQLSDFCVLRSSGTTCR